MSSSRVFVVTGANKGIGKSIVKLLLQDKLEKIVYLTSRNIEMGQKAVQEFKAFDMNPLYHQLDITDEKSIKTFRDYLQEKHGGLDVLVNNAGIAYKLASEVPFSEQAKGTVYNDFFGTLSVCNHLFPIMRNNGRVVNLSAATIERVYPKLSATLQDKFSDSNLSMGGLKELMVQFVADAKDNKIEENGWPKHAYGMSKIGITLMTILQQKEFDRCNEKNIIVNCCCPGTVDTDMTGGKYPEAIPPDEGADTPTYLALLPNNTDIKGCFVKLRSVTVFPPRDKIF